MAITGKGGAVLIGSNRIAEISTWSLDPDNDDVDTTNFDSDGWREFLAGLKQWSGSFEGNFVPGDTTGQKALFAAWVNGQPVNLVLQVEPGVRFSGQAYVKPSVEVPVDDKATITVDFQGTGPLTLPD